MSSYHPRRARNEILEAAEIQRIIRESKYMTIAMSKETVPYIVTLSCGYDAAKNCFYFHCANQGDKLDCIRANPQVCATIIEDHGYLETRCDHDYSSLVLRGEMSIVSGLDEKKHGLNILLNHLEKDPAPIYTRTIKDDQSYGGVTILKLQVASVIGKKYTPD